MPNFTHGGRVHHDHDLALGHHVPVLDDRVLVHRVLVLQRQA